MKSYSKKNTIKNLDYLINNISKYLVNEFKSRNYIKFRRFYSDTFFATSLKLTEAEPEIQKELMDNYKKDGNFNHEEFNYFALQIYSNKKIEKKITFKHSFLRKVTNWVLLRSLVEVRQRNITKKTMAIIKAFIVVTINSKYGYFTDNSIRMFYTKKTSISSQYHAFATSLLGELYTETKFVFFKNKFFKGLDIITKEIENNGEYKMIGRGKKQIFGYASAINSFSIAYKLTGEKKYIQYINNLLLYIKRYMNTEGKIPLVLSKNNTKKYWYSYNNLLDYQSFFLLYLIISKNNLG